MGYNRAKSERYLDLGLSFGCLPEQNIYDETTDTPIEWTCQAAQHSFQASYHDLKSWGACPHCHPHMVNGVATSLPQRRLQQLLGGQLNYPHKGYSIDLALILEGCPVAIEYDGAYWHPTPQPERDQALLEDGWLILRIRAKSNILPQSQIEQALDLLLAGSIRLLEITLQEAL